VELAEPPPGAEDLLLDLPPAIEPRGWHTAEALPEIIAGLHAKGFVLSQVGEMVGDAPGAR
jgi:hypothetical protein